VAIAPTAGDPRFFQRAGPFPLADIIAAVRGGPADGPPPADPGHLFTGVAPLQSAGPDQVSFLDNRRYATILDSTGAGAVIVSPAMAERVPPGCAAIVTPEPYLGWAHAAALFHPLPAVRPGRHPTALVDDAAIIDPSVEIGPFAVIGARAEIGPRCRIGIGAVIGEGVVIGADGRVGAHATLSHALIGARVHIFPGVRIGQEGFGFAPSATGFVTVPQLGRVIIEDDVEIGANTTIDRGSVQDTVIGAGTRLDNLVQIGHNVQVGRCCVIVAQVGISGSTVLEDFVQVAGQAGLSGHVRIGRKARIGGQCGVMSDVPAGADMLGSPAMPLKDFFRQVAVLRRLAGRKPGTADSKADHGGGEAAGQAPARNRTAD
jgi:UDP-3-O-[3-hydroxymyristoyl] glucosamine N-acyltransferase